MCAPAPRAMRACAIPRELGTVACGLGYTIDFVTKPVDVLVSRAQSFRTPRAGKAINRATSDKIYKFSLVFISLEYFDDETI